ncbi:MAG: hypothetical protein K2P87_14330 [Lachnospiraceae bacterium]|nr:hypothetical protein [Lachnospiraceae bacterium]
MQKVKMKKPAIVKKLRRPYAVAAGGALFAGADLFHPAVFSISFWSFFL